MPGPVLGTPHDVLVLCFLRAGTLLVKPKSTPGCRHDRRISICGAVAAHVDAAVPYMDFLDDSADGEILDGPVKPGTVRIILADSQAIYRVGFARFLLWKTICAWWRRPIPLKICARR